MRPSARWLTAVGPAQPATGRSAAAATSPVHGKSSSRPTADRLRQCRPCRKRAPGRVRFCLGNAGSSHTALTGPFANSSSQMVSPPAVPVVHLAATAIGQTTTATKKFASLRARFCQIPARRLRAPPTPIDHLDGGVALLMRRIFVSANGCVVSWGRLCHGAMQCGPHSPQAPGCLFSPSRRQSRQSSPRSGR